MKLILCVFLIQVASTLLLRTLPGILLEKIGASLPRGYFIDVQQLVESQPTGTEATVIGYRILCTLAVLMGGYLNSVVTLLCGSYLILRITRYYLAFTQGDGEMWPERPKKTGYVLKVIGMVAFTALILLGSLLVGLCYNTIFDRTEPIRIIAHRTGGTMASENSIEGLYKAIEHGCYASETDVQRTKDGYYIINHDNTFERLTGVNKHPEDMTLEEIRELRIKDTTGSGEELSVVTLDEMLDVIRGKEKLFIEMKGASADNQMVDDVVRMVKSHGCMDDCVLISLNYDIIDYAEILDVFLALLAFLPMFLSWYVVQGWMAILGLPFNLINIVISTFIFGIGVDYSIFVMQGLIAEQRCQSSQLLEYHKVAIFFSAFVLIVVVVSMLFATHPAITSIGVSTLIGMASTILITYTLQPLLFRWLTKWPFMRRRLDVKR